LQLVREELEGHQILPHTNALRDPLERSHMEPNLFQTWCRLTSDGSKIRALKCYESQLQVFPEPVGGSGRCAREVPSTQLLWPSVKRCKSFAWLARTRRRSCGSGTVSWPAVQSAAWCGDQSTPARILYESSKELDDPGSVPRVNQLASSCICASETGPIRSCVQSATRLVAWFYMLEQKSNSR